MGWNGTLWPGSHAPEVLNNIFYHTNMNLPFSKSEENFASIDYAVFRAGQLGLKLIVPLTGRDMNQLIYFRNLST